MRCDVMRCGLAGSLVCNCCSGTARGYSGGRAAAGRSKSAITILAAERNGNHNDLGLANARLALAPSTGAMRFDRSALKHQCPDLQSRLSGYNHVISVPRALQLPGWALEHRDARNIIHGSLDAPFTYPNAHISHEPHVHLQPHQTATQCDPRVEAARLCCTCTCTYATATCAAAPTHPRPHRDHTATTPRPRPPPSQPCQTRLRKLQPSRAPHRPMRLNKVREAHSTALRCAATSLSASCACA